MTSRTRPVEERKSDGDHRRRRRLSGSGRVWVLNGLMVAAGAALFFGPVKSLTPFDAPFRFPWWSLAAMFLLAEIYVVHLQFRRDAHSFSLGEVPLVLGLFFATPVVLVLAQLTGICLALAFHRRQSPLRLLFNLGHFFIEGCLAVIIFHYVVRLGEPIGAAGWAGTFIATSVTSLIGVLMIMMAIGLSEGRFDWKALPKTAGLGLLVTAANTSLALIAVTILWQDPMAVWLLIVPTVTLFLAYRAYTSERAKHDSLEFLYETTRMLQGSREAEGAMQALLYRASSMFRAEVAEILLFPPNENEPTLRTLLAPDGSVEIMKPVDLDPLEGVWARVASEGQAVLLARPISNPRLNAYYESIGIRDAMVAPLHGETRVMGTIMIGNRLGDVSTFDDEDLKLFETLANHASVSLERGRLEESVAKLTELEGQLKHQAFHDSLTGLANRALFTNRVEHALAHRRIGSTAVLFIDIDDFKTINDSLGHEAGDGLLVSVAERIQTCLRPADTPARLGGDEFAILLEEMSEPADALRIADRIIDSTRSPFILQGKEIFIHASIGIAVNEDGRAEASELLRNADVAMYRAKSRGKGRYEMFQPAMHEAALSRLRLKGELQRAVDQHEFSVLYQPLVDVESGALVGAEALVRWMHPQHGLVSPDRFIALAEETGLILPMGRWVLERACHQARAWQLRSEDARNLVINVNLSARQLQNPALVDEVAVVLRSSGLPPASLTLEITESVLMADTEAAISQLQALKKLGVKLALDDFGTGYSSLSYLRQFPIDILKVAKPFVDSLLRGVEDAALAHAIIKMGKTLGLETIAEGVELRDQWTQLKRLGCDIAQGFYFSAPIKEDAFVSFLEERGTTSSAPRAANDPQIVIPFPQTAG
jgi:diguanylate cyclase (GGDEF)-like protein